MENGKGINKKFKKEIASGISSLVLLSFMDQSKESMYGYQIAKMLTLEVEEAPLIKKGALYPVLRSLEKSGLLISEVEPSVSGPPRKYYSITNLGKSTLNEWVEIWNQAKQFVDNVLQGDNSGK